MATAMGSTAGMGIGMLVSAVVVYRQFGTFWPLWTAVRVVVPDRLSSHQRRAARCCGASALYVYASRLRSGTIIVVGVVYQAVPEALEIQVVDELVELADVDAGAEPAGVGSDLEGGLLAGRLGSGREPAAQRVVDHRLEAVAAAVRQEAKLLGYADFTEVSLASKMAPDVGSVSRLLDELRRASFEPAKRELEDLRALAREEGAPEAEDFALWDVLFWSERLRERLACEGIAAPVYLVQSNGGVTTPETAARLPAPGRRI